jgi:hypothetical protein
LTDANGQIITAALNNNAVTDAKLRDSIATSVIGRSANNAGDTADIQATADGQYLRRAGGILGFGAIAASELGSGTADNTKFLRGDQQWASSVNSLRKSADQTISGAYVNVSDLTIPVLAGRDYTFEFTVVLTTSAGTEGYALAMSGPASTEFTYEVEARTSSTAQTQNFQFSANDAMTATGSGPGGTRTISRVRGVLRNPTTNGTLALRARPEGGGTVTIKQGSWGLWF